jgi:ketosteroid isomerase-like protein
MQSVEQTVEENEILDFLEKHLQSIQDNDSTVYRETTSNDLTLYEWWVTPHRIDGLPFHEFMMQANARAGTVFGTEPVAAAVQGRTGPAPTRFDLSNLCIQRYGDTVIASYTLLISSQTQEGARVVAHNESRVMVKDQSGWKVVHVHKSPAWAAPHVAPDEK